LWETGGWRQGPTRKEQKKELGQGEDSRLKTGHSLLKSAICVEMGETSELQFIRRQEKKIPLQWSDQKGTD